MTTKKYIIRVNDDYYIKYSDSSRPYGGSISLTKDIKQAKLYTREEHAINKGEVLIHRYICYESDKVLLSKKYNIIECPRISIEATIVDE